MKISTKGRYALRLMVELAQHPDTLLTVREISQRQQISAKYLEQIIASLNKGGFVRSIRGAQGGYRLQKKPEDCTVGAILRQIEGSMAPVECLELDESDCPRHKHCATLVLWKKINDAVNQVIDTVTLADLLEWALEEERAEKDGEAEQVRGNC